MLPMRLLAPCRITSAWQRHPLPSLAPCSSLRIVCRVRNPNFSLPCLASPLPVLDQSRHKTDLAVSKLAVQPSKPHNDYRRTQLDQSLSRLGIKDLSALLTVTGLPLTGTKTVLANRLATHLHSIARRVDKISLEGGFGFLGQSSRRVSAQKTDQEVILERLKDHLLPRSIVSIDIGIRNLAWVELSRDGEILRWSLEDLLSHSPANDAKDGTVTPLNQTASAGQKGKKHVRPSTAPFDQRSVAMRLDEVMRKIMDGGSLQAVVVERQRFRTAGMHSILDATFKCGVVEGMIHMWLAVWEHDWVQGRKKESQKGKPHQQDLLDREENDEGVIIEAVSPKAVAQWWGIGATSKKARDFKCKDENAPEYDEDAPLEGGNSMNLIKKTPRHYTKKLQSRAMVDKWMDIHADMTYSTLGGKSSEDHGFRVRCRPELKEWYAQETKRDDLSDCLLQAVAWFEWRERAIEEAVLRSGIGQEAVIASG